MSLYFQIKMGKLKGKAAAAEQQQRRNTTRKSHAQGAPNVLLTLFLCFRALFFLFAFFFSSSYPVAADSWLHARSVYYLSTLIFCRRHHLSHRQLLPLAHTLDSKHSFVHLHVQLRMSDLSRKT